MRDPSNLTLVPPPQMRDGFPTDLDRPAPPRCAACGYPRRGLREAALCPECGNDPAAQPLHLSRASSDAWWARSVITGLLLLVAAAFTLLGVTLYMRFRSDWGGSLPVLNYPGPKVWGVALLQRSIGSRPGEWGVAGTRSGLIVLVGVWLVTAPRLIDRYEEGWFSLRRLCRWLTLILAGGAVGVLLGESGISAWSDSVRNTFNLVLLSLVELPGTMLLYLYLLKLARPLADRQLLGNFRILAVGVPILISGAALFILTGDFWEDDKRGLLQLLLIAVYGAGCVSLGALGTASVVRLAWALLPAAELWKPGAATLARRASAAGEWVLDRPATFARWAVAGGLLAWVGVTVLALRDVLMLNFRTGYGGNWPILNVPGPKVWATPLLSRFDGTLNGTYDAFLRFGTVSSIVTLLLVTLVVWAITTRGIRPERNELTLSLRRWTRWGTAGLLGLAAGLAIGIDQGGVVPLSSAFESHTVRSAVALPLTMFVEAPATLLVYLYLATVAQSLGRRGLERQLSWVGIAITTLILAGNGFFALSSAMSYGARIEAVVLVPVALYGAAAVAVGVWSTGVVLALARALIAANVRELLNPKPVELTLFPL